ncbi:MAG: AAA family ATPase, partial [Acidimicrobiales bacterium]|nr:AAA family ATPase [Acidimicrobiales bacterium]
GDFAAAIEAAVRRLDRSYLAVQGPPGTGKTWTGARVVRALVEDGWKVGVVAQGHRTIEQLLDEAIGAGLDPERVVKRADRGGDHRGRKLGDRDLLAAVTGEGGLLVGGTSYDLVNDHRVPAGSLDLLVIDEAGQFSLADTLAV